MTPVTVIIVTHNDQGPLHRTMEALLQQTTPPKQIVIVDSGSKDTSFLSQYDGTQGIDLLYSKTNIGFAGGNNFGYLCLEPDVDYVFFLNPDVFLEPQFIEKSVDLMKIHPKWGALSGILQGYDFNKDQPTNKYDTTGIFQTWYGKWYDRGQGQTIVPGKYQQQEEVPALCGAALFCRTKALEQIQSPWREVFDPKFFMYKEDIDLSLRLRNAGWKLVYCPSLQAFHCRGWNPNRKKMPQQLRLLSAKNELKIHLQLRSWRGIIYSFIKYVAVRCFNV